MDARGILSDTELRNGMLTLYSLGTSYHLP